MLKLIVMCASVALFAALPAAAGGLSATQSIERRTIVEAADGTPTTLYVPAEKATPGDQVRYVMNYANNGQAAADAVVLAVPIPSEVQYVENSATNGNAIVAFSADGGKSFAPRGELIVSSDGTQRDAVAEDITHVRWTFTTAIMPGQTGKLSFDAVLR